MQPIKVGLISHTKRLRADELKRVATALQKQVENDFAPLWKINATIEPFTAGEKVPKGYWPVNVRDRIEPEGAWSIHSVKDGCPFAEVTYGDQWTLGASHDLLEMLVDPKVNRRIKAESHRPKPRL